MPKRYNTIYGSTDTIRVIPNNVNVTGSTEVINSVTGSTTIVAMPAVTGSVTVISTPSITGSVAVVNTPSITGSVSVVHVASDFLLEVAKGNIAGHALKIIRGHNSDVDTGTEDIWEAGGSMTYLTTASVMNIASTDDEDGGAGSDTGALTTFIEGVDGTGAYISETVTNNGTTNVTTSNSYLRVNFMTVLTAGSLGWNKGNITAKAVTGGSTQDEMDAQESISQSSHHTIPLNKKGYLYKVELNGARIAGGNNTPEIEFRGYARPTGASRAWIQLFDKRMDTAIDDELDIELPFPTLMPARTDIRFTAQTDLDNTDCRTRMYLMQVDD